MNKILLATEVLDKIWMEWLKKQTSLTHFEKVFLVQSPFKSATHYPDRREQFKDWIFSTGGSIRQINKKFYIEFTDPSRASFFLLKWT